MFKINKVFEIPVSFDLLYDFLRKNIKCSEKGKIIPLLNCFLNYRKYVIVFFLFIYFNIIIVSVTLNIK